MKKWANVVFATLLAIALGGCSESKEVGFAGSEAKVVETTEVVQKTLTQVTELSGTLEASERTQVAFEVAGRIVKLDREQGEKINQGDVLGKLDDTDYQLSLQRAATGVNQAKAALEKVQNGARAQEVDQAKLGLQRAQLNYEKAVEDQKKYEQLYQSGAVSKDTLDTMALKAELAERELKNAEAGLSMIMEGARPEDKETTKSVYEQNLIVKEQAETTLQKTVLKSPVSGTIITKFASEGQLINSGTPIYEVGNVNQLKVILPVPDREIADWAIGDLVELSLYDNTRKGTVAQIYPATNQGTGTIGIEVKVDNQDRKWFVGQVVKATHEKKGAKGLFVPVSAVVSTGGKQPFVYLVKDQKAHKQPVEIGQLVDNQLQILSGLTEGDIVVSKGADRLFDGDTLQTQAPTSSESEAGGGSGK